MRPPGPEIWRDAVLDLAPRIVSLLDRDPAGSAPGSFDRTWWGWKFTDAPRPRLQEGVCVLAFLYALDEPANPWRGHPSLPQWIADALLAWTRLQHRDGSFDEACPYERSMAATAFSSFAVAETLELVGDVIPGAARSAADAALERAARWLLSHDEDHGVLTNHRAAVAAAVFHAARRTGNDAFARGARRLIERIVESQSPEGWFPEYGGADPGYQTHATFYLARLDRLRAHPDLGPALARACAFLKWFVHVDGSVGGEYGRRKTTLALPAGFELLGEANEDARAIAYALRRGHAERSATPLAAMDEMNLFPMACNLAFAWIFRCSDAGVPLLPCTREADAWFPEAGLLVRSTRRYHAIVAAGEGGVVVGFARGSGARVRAFVDCGWLATWRGAICASQWHRSAGPQDEVPHRIEIEVPFVKVRDLRPRPSAFLLLRAFNLTVGRIGFLTRWLKRVAVRALITREQQVPGTLRRTIALDEDSIVVTDQVRWRGTPPDDLRPVARYVPFHMGSARYFTSLDFAHPPATSSTTTTLADGRERRTEVRFDAPDSGESIV
jgi:hypothetical protein